MKDSQGDGKNVLRSIIRSKKKKEFEELSDILTEYLESEDPIKS
mgnify:FL=1